LFVLASYTLVANELLRPKLVFADHWTGIFGSHIFFGALLLFGFLLSVRFRGTEPLRVASRTKSLRALLFG